MIEIRIKLIQIQLEMIQHTSKLKNRNDFSAIRFEK